VSIEPVGKAGWLAHIEIVESIIVDVSDRNSIVSINVNAARTVENRPPVVSPPKQLGRVRQIAAECGRCDVHENGSRGAASRLVQRLPTSQAEFTPWRSRGADRRFPFEFPMPHALLAVEGSPGAHQIVPDASLQPIRNTRRRWGHKACAN